MTREYLQFLAFVFAAAAVSRTVCLDDFHTTQKSTTNIISIFVIEIIFMESSDQEKTPLSLSLISYLPLIRIKRLFTWVNCQLGRPFFL